MKKNSKKRESKDYLLDIFDSTERIEKFVVNFNFKKFSEDEKTIYASIMTFGIIGEASKNIPASIKSKHKEIPWKKMAGMRDKLIHEYFGINKEVLWKTIKEDVPELKKKMLELIKELDISRKTNKLV